MTTGVPPASGDFRTSFWFHLNQVTLEISMANPVIGSLALTTVATFPPSQADARMIRWEPTYLSQKTSSPRTLTFEANDCPVARMTGEPPTLETRPIVPLPYCDQ
jgi:hypothetical protein